MKRKTIYAALDLHSNNSVLGRMDHECRSLGATRFATGADTLKEQVGRLTSQGRRRVHLTLEAGSLSRWAAGIVRPLVGAAGHLRAAAQPLDQHQSDQEPG